MSDPSRIPGDHYDGEVSVTQVWLTSGASAPFPEWNEPSCWRMLRRV